VRTVQHNHHRNDLSDSANGIHTAAIVNLTEAFQQSTQRQSTNHVTHRTATLTQTVTCTSFCVQCMVHGIVCTSNVCCMVLTMSVVLCCVLCVEIQATYPCTECSKSFLGKSRLTQHIKRQHRSPKKTAQSPSKCVCPHCKTSYKGKRQDTFMKHQSRCSKTKSVSSEIEHASPHKKLKTAESGSELTGQLYRIASSDIA